MSAFKLSKRLKEISSMVPSCNILADIGCDHGYLAIDVVSKGIAKSAIASDINEGPLEIARKNIISVGLEDRIKLICCDGLKGFLDIHPEVIVVAGMGGELIIQILRESWNICKAASCIIVSAHSNIAMVREFLSSRGCIADERMLIDSSKYYTIIAFKADENESYTDKTNPNKMFLEYGKILLEKRDPVLNEYLLKEKAHWKSLRAKIKDESRLAEIDEKLATIEESLRYFNES